MPAIQKETDKHFSSRRRRNLLTFWEETWFYAAIIFYFLLESAAFFLIYQLQDSIGPDAVFYAMHILYAVFDLLFMVSRMRMIHSFLTIYPFYFQGIVPWVILYRSYTSHHEVWFQFTPRSSVFLS